MYNIQKVTHNTNAEIVRGEIDKDSYMTYYKDKHTGVEGMEYYTGKNYKVNSDKKSYSRNYSPDKIPKKYKESWDFLKSQNI
jgi:hypothetical protein